VYLAEQTAITFQDSGGSAVLTLLNLGFGVGRISARYDRGVSPRPYLYEWRANFHFETAPAIGEVIDVYLAESDGTYVDGGIGTADAALGTDKRRNLKRLGGVVADTVSVPQNLVASGLVTIFRRYISIGVWNGSAADNLRNTSNTSLVILTPYVEEIQ
jgi:hypothetical protein